MWHAGITAEYLGNRHLWNRFSVSGKQFPAGIKPSSVFHTVHFRHIFGTYARVTEQYLHLEYTYTVCTVPLNIKMIFWLKYNTSGDTPTKITVPALYNFRNYLTEPLLSALKAAAAATSSSHLCWDFVSSPCWIRHLFSCPFFQSHTWKRCSFHQERSFFWSVSPTEALMMCVWAKAAALTLLMQQLALTVTAQGTGKYLLRNSSSPSNKHIWFDNRLHFYAVQGNLYKTAINKNLFIWFSGHLAVAFRKRKNFFFTIWEKPCLKLPWTVCGPL